MKIQDLSNESIVVGYIYRFPELLEKYLELIIPKYDFVNSDLLYLYEILVNVFMKNNKVDDISIMVYISTLSNSEKTKWEKKNYLDVLRKLAKLSESSKSFEVEYEKLKTYNVLRYLDSKGFNVKDHIDKLKDKNIDFILKSYEYELSKVSTHIHNLNDSIKIGDDIETTYNNHKKNPDIGIQIPFRIINALCRGWRTRKVYANAMHSGFGKSRFIVHMLTYMSIINQTPILLCVNEQDKEEIQLMLLTCVANNVFSDKYGFKINETQIALGKVNDKEDEMMIKAARYIKERSKIHFLEMESWDLNTIKTILKRHKLRGINYAMIDTFKAMRGLSTNLNDWQQFVYTAEQLKAIVGSPKKNGLDMGLWLTLQMTDESFISKIMNSLALTTGKQIKHHLDFLMFSRLISAKEKDNIKLNIQMPNNPFNGTIQKLADDKMHYLSIIDKNRGGVDKQWIIHEINKGEMIFKELGYAKFGGD